MHNVGVIFAGEIIKNSFQNALEPILKIKVMIPGFFWGLRNHGYLLTLWKR